MEVGGPRHFEFEFFARDGMIEGQGGRVEGLSRSTACVLDRRSIGQFAIDCIAAQDVAGFGQVDTDLVGTAGFQLAFDQAVGSDFFDRSDVRDRALLGGIGGIDSCGLGTAVSIATVADQHGVEGLLLGMPVHDGMVLADHPVMLEGID